jgi:hypothetical protein
MIWLPSGVHLAAGNLELKLADRRKGLIIAEKSILCCGAK